jgi:sulfate transport system substrate-binding protein
MRDRYEKALIATVLEQPQGEFLQLQLFTIDQVFGGWQQVQATQFTDGGVFDRSYVTAK